VDDLVKALGIDSGISKSEYRGSAPTSTWKWRRSVTARHVGVGLDHGSAASSGKPRTSRLYGGIEFSSTLSHGSEVEQLRGNTSTRFPLLRDGFGRKRLLEFQN
jgi:hypothetical protein